MKVLRVILTKVLPLLIVLTAATGIIVYAAIDPDASPWAIAATVTLAALLGAAFSAWILRPDWVRELLDGDDPDSEGGGAGGPNSGKGKG